MDGGVANGKGGVASPACVVSLRSQRCAALSGKQRSRRPAKLSRPVAAASSRARSVAVPPNGGSGGSPKDGTASASIAGNAALRNRGRRRR